jgi:type IV pilus assembly protein PilO
MDLTNPKLQRILLTSVLGAMVLYVYFGSTFLGFGYLPRKHAIADLQSQYESVSRDLERARLTVGNLPKLEREYEYLHKQWTVAQSLLPRDNEMADLLRTISAAGQQSGLEWVKFQPETPLVRDYYTENPIFIEVEGGYHQVGTFLGQISNLSRIVNVRDLKMVGVKPEKQAEPEVRHTVDATMRIVAYTVPDQPTPTDADGQTKQLNSTDKRLGRVGDSVRGKLDTAREKHQAKLEGGQ